MLSDAKIMKKLLTKIFLDVIIIKTVIITDLKFIFCIFIINIYILHRYKQFIRIYSKCGNGGKR